MKKYFTYLLIFISAAFYAQDKMVFKDGRNLNCKIISINPSTVTYRDSLSGSNLITVPKVDVLMAEFKSGSVYIFGNDNTNTSSNSTMNSINKSLDRKAQIREKEREFKDNIIGVQLPDLVFGRLTLTYERLFLDKQLGIAVPISLSYDPRILYLGTSTDTSNSSSKVRKNVSFVTGVDVNFYFESKSHTKFFVGPRLRYGTDVNLGNITAYSVQFQNGILMGSKNGKMASTLAIGFGFARIIASPFGNGINPNQSYPWASFTFRLGFRA